MVEIEQWWATAVAVKEGMKLLGFLEEVGGEGVQKFLPWIRRMLEKGVEGCADTRVG